MTQILLPYENLTKGVFLKRYKRFLVDVKRKNGLVETVHCANSGSMQSCLLLNADVYTSESLNPNRKLKHTLEIIKLEDGLCCVNTQRANALFENVLASVNFLNQKLLLKDFSDVAMVHRECAFNKETRFDFKVTSPRQVSWIEIKSVSLRMDERTLAFPDAVTTRGQKHLRALMEARARGERAILVFVIMRATDISSDEVAQQFRPAYEIDSVYNDLFKQALCCGVEIRCLVASITTAGLGIRGYFEYPMIS